MELAALNLSPDAWDYLATYRTAAAIPEWADVRRISWGHDENGVPNENGPLTDVAYYPEEPPVLCLPSMEPSDYQAGKPEPLVNYTPSPCWYYFAVRMGESWGLDESLVSLMDMHFRGTSLIVRSSLSVFLHDYLELPAAKWFGYRVPDTIKVDVVCDGHGALSKHRQQVGSPGTVRYSLKKIGAAELRRRILKSAAKPATGIPLHWQEVVGHD